MNPQKIQSPDKGAEPFLEFLAPMMPLSGKSTSLSHDSDTPCISDLTRTPTLLVILAFHVSVVIAVHPQALAQPGLLHPECQDMFAAASPLEGMPARGAAYLDSSEELDERCAPLKQPLLLCIWCCPPVVVQNPRV